MIITLVNNIIPINGMVAKPNTNIGELVQAGSSPPTEQGRVNLFPRTKPWK
jgi:hypothetical protein